MSKFVSIEDHFTLLPDVFSEFDWSALIDHTDWKQNQIRVFNQTHLEPRLTQWYGPPYSYSSVRWPEKPLPEILLPLQKKTEQLCGYSFNAALLNLYRNGEDSMGWHADNEREIDQKCIASISFGASRKFKIRHRKFPELKTDFWLENGSLLLMKDAQKDWLHAVPKTKKVHAPRLNITFRNINT